MAFLDIPEYYNDHPDLLKKMIRVTKGMMHGKTNNTGTFTLTANSATTTVTFADGRLGQNTVVLWMPTTANAATAMANLYLSARNVLLKTITLTHTNTATVDRIYNYVLIG